MQAKTYSTDSGSNGQGDDTLASAAATPLRAVPAIPGEVRNFVADIGDLIKAATSLTGDDLTRAREKLGERVAAARASLEKAGNEVASRVRHTAKVTDGYVHDRPWQAIGIGAAVGLLVGILLARRRA